MTWCTGPARISSPSAGTWRGSQPDARPSVRRDAAPRRTRDRQAARPLPDADTCQLRHVRGRAGARGRSRRGPRRHPGAASGRRRGRSCWPSSRATDDPPSFRGSSRKGGGQALLVGLMVLAFLVLVIARTAPQSGAGAPQPGAGASPSGPAGGVALDRRRPPAAPSIAASGRPERDRRCLTVAIGGPGRVAVTRHDSRPRPPRRSTAPSATPAAATTYKVRSGDTLSAHRDPVRHHREEDQGGERAHVEHHPDRAGAGHSLTRAAGVGRSALAAATVRRSGSRRP